jgi:hypothetical protein
LGSGLGRSAANHHRTQNRQINLFVLVGMQKKVMGLKSMALSTIRRGRTTSGVLMTEPTLTINWTKKQLKKKSTLATYQNLYSVQVIILLKLGKKQQM